MGTDVCEGAAPLRCSRVRFLTFPRLVFSYAQSFAALLRARRYLGTPRARNRFVRILDQVRSRFRFLLIGYVVMPEHVHLVMSEPKKGNPSKVLQVLKQRVSRSLRKPGRKPSAQLSLMFAAATG